MQLSNPALRQSITGPAVVTTLVAAALFYQPFASLLTEWWKDPDAGHGLLLAPLALWLAWKSGLRPDRAGQRSLGIGLLVGAIMLRYVSGLAAELFMMRISMVAAGAALVVYYWGARQILHWWLPASLLILSVPLPTVLLNTIALPLQIQASQLGANLLEWRDVPVSLQGNVIQFPGHALFVTEACSGLRSLTALLSIGLLVGGMWLRTITGRTFLIASALVVAITLNGVRVFLTGFLVFFVSPEWGEGFMHYSEGWAIFVAAFGILALLSTLIARAEQRWAPAS